ncbi:ComEC/Rec2 family competence protein, partial [Streptomyces alkaliterrae]|uniref:ComEC/Rec2 family competence protein n=1 Tax=Streptomyces alkaliterrae TaxID=2213162 RepID=UPI002B1EEEAA
MAAWVAAALAPALSAGAVALLVCGCLVAATVLGVAGRRRARSARDRPARERRTWISGGVLVAAGAALLCAAAGATAAGLHTAAVHDGPLPELAKEHAHVTLRLTLTGDPRRTRGRPGQPRTVVVAPATAIRVAQGDGTATVIRNPVLVVVPPERAEAWLGLLPSTTLEVRARLAAPDDGRAGDIAALARVTEEVPRTLAPPDLAQRLAGSVRQGLLDATDGLPEDARAMIPALVMGDTSRLPTDLWNAVRAADMTHLIVVSGAHVSLVLAVFIGAPGTASRSERRGLAALLGVPLRTTAVLGAGVLIAFTVVCRPGPSVLRAAVCGGITLLAIATGRRRSLLPALAAAALLLVLYDPALARSYGFLLSVLATGALLVIAPRWSLFLQQRGAPVPLAEAMAATAAAQAVCAPVVAVFAARVSLVALPCNLLAGLAFAPATLLGCLALASAPVSGTAAGAAAWLASWPARWIAAVARTGAGLPGAEIGWPGGWAGAAALAAVTGGVLLVLRPALRRPWAVAVLVLLLVLAVLRPHPLARWVTGWPPPDWRLVACDVGQGDALVLSAGGRGAVVVDVGPDPAAVDSCLRDLGVRHIPLLVLTHFHADHVSGLTGALSGRSVGAIQTSTLYEPPGQAEFVRQEARKAGVPMAPVVAGERRRLG